MTLGQLKDSIPFEAKLGDIDALGGWLDLTIKEVLDDYTSQVKYDELFVPDTVVSATLAGQTVTLPSDVQHIDLAHVRFRRGGVATNDLFLYVRAAQFGPNQGLTRFVSRVGNTLQFWPYNELDTTDQFIFNYWKLPSVSIVNNASVIIPNQLIPVIKKEVILRAMTFSNSDDAGMYRQLAKESYSRSFGTTDVGSANG